MVHTEDIERTVVDFYMRSHDFNGLPMFTLLRNSPDAISAKAAVESLIRKGRISCCFASVSINMHIKRFPDLSIDDQLALLSKEPSDSFCLYPSPDLVRANFDVSKFDDRPFTKKLALGAAQLDWEGFDLGVLDRYYNDPRYLFRFEDHQGRLSVHDDANEDKSFPERDKVLLQSFGVGYDETGRRVAVVFLRYLSGLSPEHQQYWNTFIIPEKTKLHREYYRASYLGEWPEYGSYFGAILTEIKLINELSKGVFGKPLFRSVPDEERPAELTPFLRPTLRNFNDFVLAMDKLLSENIDHDFFDGQIVLEKETIRPDGKVIVERKGTLALLEQWLRTSIGWEDTEKAVRVIVEPLRRIRRLRRGPAHKLEKDKFSQDYDTQQHEIVRDSYISLMSLREALNTHPAAPKIKVPRWIAEGKIAFA